jgi:hypothetical protein
MWRYDEMTLQQKRATVSAAIFVVLVLLMNIFLVGGVEFVQYADAILPLPLAGLSSVLFFNLWRSSKKEEVGRKIWGALLVGLCLWTISEAYYSIYTLLGLDPPFPSLADLTWFLAYFFFFWGFSLRFRSLQITLKSREINYILLTYIPLVVLTLVFSIVPLFGNAEQRILAFALSLFYPLADLVIPLRAITVFITLRKGTLFRPWALIGVSFLCFSIADLAFSYAERNGIYWVSGNTNFISIFGDWIYIVAYAIMALGVYFVSGASEMPAQEIAGVQSISPATQPLKKPIIIITDAAGTICYSSPGAFEAKDQSANSQRIGENVSRVLELGKGTITDIIAKNAASNNLGTQIIRLQEGGQTGKQFNLSVFPNFDAQGRFIGADFLLRPLTGQVGSAQEVQNVQEYLQIRENREGQTNVDDILAWYFRSEMRVLYVLIARMAGTSVARTLMTLINSTTKENHWAIEMGKTGFEITDSLAGSTDEKAKIYRNLLKLVADYAIVVASYATTIRETHLFDQTLDERTRKIVSAHGLIFPTYTPS